MIEYYTGALNAKKAKEKWEAKRAAYDRVSKNLTFHSNILYINIDKSQEKIIVILSKNNNVYINKFIDFIIKYYRISKIYS